jgi:hypothetical protein
MLNYIEILMVIYHLILNLNLSFLFFRNETQINRLVNNVDIKNKSRVKFHDSYVSSIYFILMSKLIRVLQ